MDELRWFTAKKAILVSFCFIDIVVYIIYASAAKHFANKFITENGSNKENSTATTADAIEDELVYTIRMIVVGSLVGIALQAIGIWGAIRHNLYMCSAYSIFMTVGAVISIVRSYDNLSRYWLNTTWSVAIATTSLLFLWDLYYRAQVKRIKRRSVKLKGTNQEMFAMNSKTHLNSNLKTIEFEEKEENISFIDKHKLEIL